MEPELTPTSLGELLRRARAVRGVSLAQVEAETRIRRRYLEAIEADDLPALPAPVYTRGLVRAYASYLGVDQVEAGELLRKEEARAEAFGVQPSVQNVPVGAAGGGIPVRAIAVAIVLAVLGALVGLMLPRYTQLFAPATAVAQVRTPGPEAAPAAAPTAQPTPLPTATSAPTAVPSPTPQPSPTLGAEARSTATAAAAVRGVTIDAKISGRVWAQVESDGRVSYSGILQPGERKVWRAERRLSLYVGDGGLVDVTYNGQTIGPLGPKGEVARQEWAASR